MSPSCGRSLGHLFRFCAPVPVWCVMGSPCSCYTSTPSPPSHSPRSVAWVGRDGRLLFGRLDPELKLRWTTAYIGESNRGICTMAVPM